jgi:hypothetical protein
MATILVVVGGAWRECTSFCWVQRCNYGNLHDAARILQRKTAIH